MNPHTKFVKKSLHIICVQGNPAITALCIAERENLRFDLLLQFIEE